MAASVTTAIDAAVAATATAIATAAADADVIATAAADAALTPLLLGTTASQSSSLQACTLQTGFDLASCAPLALPPGSQAAAARPPPPEPLLLLSLSGAMNELSVVSDCTAISTCRLCSNLLPRRQAAAALSPGAPAAAAKQADAVNGQEGGVSGRTVRH